MTPFQRPLRKAGALALALVYFLTNSALAQAPESKFWAERRRQVRNLPPESGSPRLLASLSAPDASPLTRELPRLQTQGFMPSLPRQAQLLAALRPAYGRVRAIDAGLGQKTVVYLQDVHMNPEAQANIGKVVQELIDHRKVDLIALEGASTPIDLSRFRNFPRPDVTRMVADYFLKTQRISGPIHAALTSAEPIPPVVGVDDEAHYRANVDAYKQSAPLAASLKRDAARRQAALAEEKAKVLHPALRVFDAQVAAYRRGKLSLGAYVKLLDASASTPHARAFLEALALEDAMDFAAVERDRAQLIETVAHKMDRQELSSLLQMSAAHRSGQARHADFYESLQALCRKHGVALSQFPAMEKYLAYVLLSDDIDAEALMRETSRLEEQAYQRLIRTEQESRLVAEGKCLLLLEKLLNFSLTPEEWGEYKKHMEGAKESRRDVSLLSFESFYREAERRDQAMVTNLVAAMDRQNADTALLVTGGFHTGGMRRHMRQAGLNVITFAPKITQVETAAGSAYLSVFTQEKTPLEKLFAGEKLFTAPHPAGDQANALAPAAYAAADAHQNPAGLLPAAANQAYRSVALPPQQEDRVEAVTQEGDVIRVEIQSPDGEAAVTTAFRMEGAPPKARIVGEEYAVRGKSAWQRLRAFASAGLAGLLKRRGAEHRLLAAGALVLLLVRPEASLVAFLGVAVAMVWYGDSPGSDPKREEQGKDLAYQILSHFHADNDSPERKKDLQDAMDFLVDKANPKSAKDYVRFALQNIDVDPVALLSPYFVRRLAAYLQDIIRQVHDMKTIADAGAAVRHLHDLPEFGEFLQASHLGKFLAANGPGGYYVLTIDGRPVDRPVRIILDRSTMVLNDPIENVPRRVEIANEVLEPHPILRAIRGAVASLESGAGQAAPAAQGQEAPSETADPAQVAAEAGLPPLLQAGRVPPEIWAQVVIENYIKVPGDMAVVLNYLEALVRADSARAWRKRLAKIWIKELSGSFWQSDKAAQDKITRLLAVLDGTEADQRRERLGLPPLAAGRATAGPGVWAARSAAKLLRQDPEAWGEWVLRHAPLESVVVVVASLWLGLGFGVLAGLAPIALFGAMHFFSRDQLRLYGADISFWKIAVVSFFQGLTLWAALTPGDAAGPLAGMAWIVLAALTVYIHARVDETGLESQAAFFIDNKERLLALQKQWEEALASETPLDILRPRVADMAHALALPPDSLGVDQTLMLMNDVLIRRFGQRAADKGFKSAVLNVLRQRFPAENPETRWRRLLTGHLDKALLGAPGDIYFVEDLREEADALAAVLRVRAALQWETLVIAKDETALRRLRAPRGMDAVVLNGFEDGIFRLSALAENEQARTFVLRQEEVTPYAWRPLALEDDGADAEILKKFKTKEAEIIGKLLNGIALSVLQTHIEAINGLLKALQAA